jgi:hypothetical protein
MTRIKILLWALLAVLALSGLSVASASASECPGSGEGVELCSEGHALEGTFAISNKTKSGGSIYIEGIMSLQCSTTKSKGQIVAGKGRVEITSDVIEWTGCSLSGHAGCKVKAMILGMGPGLHGGISLVGEIGEVTLATSEEKQPFTEVSVTGCEQEYEGKVLGTQKCKLARVTTEAVGHEVSCTGSESRLKLRTRTVELEFHEEIQLSSGVKFSVQRG